MTEAEGSATKRKSSKWISKSDPGTEEAESQQRYLGQIQENRS